MLRKLLFLSSFGLMTPVALTSVIACEAVQPKELSVILDGISLNCDELLTSQIISLLSQKLNVDREWVLERLSFDEERLPNPKINIEVEVDNWKVKGTWFYQC